jgi:hypothetical protein
MLVIYFQWTDYLLCGGHVDWGAGTAKPAFIRKRCDGALVNRSNLAIQISSIEGTIALAMPIQWE